jgi:ankyrin repeat protein
MAKALLAGGANVNATLEVSEGWRGIKEARLKRPGPKHACTPLFSQNKATPLHVAAHGGHVGMVKVLLAAGAKFHVRDDVRLATLYTLPTRFL